MPYQRDLSCRAYDVDRLTVGHVVILSDKDKMKDHATQMSKNNPGPVG